MTLDATESATPEELGPRRALGGGWATLFAATAALWSLFQLWAASPLPFLMSDWIRTPNIDDLKIVHLAFALALAYMAFPMRRADAGDARVPWRDIALGFAAIGAVLYLLAFRDELAARPGAPTTLDLVTAGIGGVLLLEAARRALGWPLITITLIFLVYVFFGDQPWLPETLRWKGASFAKTMSHMWLSTEGVFGVALGVSAGFVFMFVLFGLLLETAGAGDYIIRLSFALLGRFRGGPAKAAVLSSGMTGLISGSSIANVVTTGTFTVPLMKRVGFSPEKAGAIEVAASTNGQLMPPIMGAAAFLMVEYVGISYLDVIRHAFLPATVSYLTLLYIVHLEAVKAGMRPLERRDLRRAAWLATGLKTALLFALLGGAFYLLSLVKMLLPAGQWGAGFIALLAVAYLALLRLAAASPDLDPQEPMETPPEWSRVWPAGAYFALPVLILVWFLTVERRSPELSAFYGTLAMVVVSLTHKPLKELLRGQRGGGVMAAWRAGGADFLRGLIGGARNMIPIGLATAVAGIIVGAVSLTGVGLVLAEFVEFVSGGKLLPMLLLVAVISLALGVGLPTTANYIVVSSLTAGIVVELGAQSGLIVPLIAVHLFVFYFGILADDTPPVGLAAFAASAISGGDPIKTGIQGFAYDMRTAMLPFFFIFNTDLLLIDVSLAEGVLVFTAAVVGMLAFASATQGWCLAKNKLWETAAMLVAAFTLLQPGFWLDRAAPPFVVEPAAKVFELAGDAPAGASLRLRVAGVDPIDAREVDKILELPLGAADADGATRLERDAGLVLAPRGAGMFVDAVVFGGPAEAAGVDFDWEVLSAHTPRHGRPPAEIFYAPALLLLGAILFAQRRRARRAEAGGEASAQA